MLWNGFVNNNCALDNHDDNDDGNDNVAHEKGKPSNRLAEMVDDRRM